MSPDHTHNRPVDCPTCGNPVTIGLPRDLAVLEVQADADSTTPEDGLRKTRRVRCPTGHDVAVYFEREYSGTG